VEIFFVKTLGLSLRRIRINYNQEALNETLAIYMTHAKMSKVYHFSNDFGQGIRVCSSANYTTGYATRFPEQMRQEERGTVRFGDKSKESGNLPAYPMASSSSLGFFNDPNSILAEREYKNAWNKQIRRHKEV
jgi:hypothetical protein